jgi:hypothetical protein
MKDLTSIKNDNMKAVISETKNEVLQSLKKNGGLTLNSETLKPVTYSTGYQVSVLNIIKYDMTLFDDGMIEKALHVAMKQSEQNRLDIGLWIDGETLYVDLSDLFIDFHDALEYCKEKNELSFYDWETKQVVYV